MGSFISQQLGSNCSLPPYGLFNNGLSCNPSEWNHASGNNSGSVAHYPPYWHPFVEPNDHLGFPAQLPVYRSSLKSTSAGLIMCHRSKASSLKPTGTYRPYPIAESLDQRLPLSTTNFVELETPLSWHQDPTHHNHSFPPLFSPAMSVLSSSPLYSRSSQLRSSTASSCMLSSAQRPIKPRHSYLRLHHTH